MTTKEKQRKNFELQIKEIKKDILIIGTNASMRVANEMKKGYQNRAELLEDIIKEAESEKTWFDKLSHNLLHISDGVQGVFKFSTILADVKEAYSAEGSKWKGIKSAFNQIKVSVKFLYETNGREQLMQQIKNDMVNFKIYEYYELDNSDYSEDASNDPDIFEDSSDDSFEINYDNISVLEEDNNKEKTSDSTGMDSAESSFDAGEMPEGYKVNSKGEIIKIKTDDGSLSTDSAFEDTETITDELSSSTDFMELDGMDITKLPEDSFDEEKLPEGYIIVRGIVRYVGVERSSYFQKESADAETVFQTPLFIELSGEETESFDAAELLAASTDSQ